MSFWSNKSRNQSSSEVSSDMQAFGNLLEEVNKVLDGLKQDTDNLTFLNPLNKDGFPEHVTINPRPDSEEIITGRVTANKVSIKAIGELLRKVPSELLSQKLVTEHGEIVQDGNGKETIKSYIERVCGEITESVRSKEEEFKGKRADTKAGTNEYSEAFWKEEVASQFRVAVFTFGNEVDRAIAGRQAQPQQPGRSQ
jgi:hypothetical protein